MRVVLMFLLAHLSLGGYAQWSQIDGLPDSFQTNFVLVEGANLMAVSEDQAWYSTNSGDTWQLVGPGLDAPVSTTKHGGEFWISSSDTLWRTEDQILPIFFYEVPTLSPGIVKAFGDKMIVTSIDEPPLSIVELQENGQLTVQRPLGTTGLSSIGSVAVSNEAIGLTDGMGIVYISDDDGASWTHISSDLFQYGANNPNDTSFLRNILGQWVITNAQLGALLSYSEIADSWIIISLPSDMQRKSVTLLEELNGTIYLGLEGGELYSSVDFRTWEEITGNLPGADILSLDISDSSMFVGLEGEGVWVTPINTHPDTSISTSLLPFLQANSLAINVYPNPTNQWVNIALLEEGVRDRNFLLAITNSLGQVLHAETYEGRPSLSLNVSHYPEGIYWVSLKTEAQSYIGPFIKY